MHKSGIVNRQIGVKKFIRVVILDPPTKGHVIQCMCNPKIAIVRYVQPKGCLMILQVSLKLQHRSTRNFICLHNENVSGDAVLWRHNKSKMRSAAILKIAKSPYLSEKSSDFDKIRYTTADVEPNDNHVTRNWNFWNSRWRQLPS